MIKTKGMEVGKVGDNYPMGYTLTGTEKVRVGGEMPTTAPLPNMQDMPAYMLQKPGQVSGYTDTGAKVGA